MKTMEKRTALPVMWGAIGKHMNGGMFFYRREDAEEYKRGMGKAHKTFGPYRVVRLREVHGR